MIRICWELHDGEYIACHAGNHERQLANEGVAPENEPAKSTVEAVNRLIEKLTLALQRIGRLYWIVAIVFTLGVVSAALLVWTDQIRQRQRVQFALAESLTELRAGVVTAHLWLEEVLHGGPASETEKIWLNVRKAMTLSEVLLNGGVSEYGAILLPLVDTELRRRVADIKELLSEFVIVSRERLQKRDEAASSSALEQRCNQLSNEIVRSTEQLETIIERSAAVDDAQSARLMFWILTLWVFLVSTSTAAVFSWERARKQVAEMLWRTNDALETKVAERTKELRDLTDVIEARTVSLTTANIALQKEVVERKEVEKALRESEERHRRLIETMNEGLVIIDDKGFLTYVNQKFCELLNYSRNELLGRRYAELSFEADRQIPVQSGGNRANTHDHDDVRKLPREVSFTNKKGEKVFTIVSPREIYDKDRNVVGYFAVITDITEKVALQAAAMRTAHLVSLGEVAAGVAHEINNPINGIINYAQILCDHYAGKSRVDGIPNRIVKEGRRIAEIVRALLLFAYGGNKDKRPTEVGEVLSDSLGLMGSEMKHEGIQIATFVPAGLPTININPQEIQQVFMNTISNARYALNQKYPGPHEEKRLHIHAEQLTIDESPFVRITFHDRGVGIPASIIDKIREPFFSTKPRGEGTGLGLSIVDGIIRNHGGKLAIESIEGEFTDVLINLPIGECDNGKYSRN
jgi:PAS domain S-box-containing protein